MPSPSSSPIRPSLLIALFATVFLALVGWIALAQWKIPPRAAPVADRDLAPPERVGIQWLRPVGAEAEYVGSETCRSCHAREFEAHARSPHSRTVRRLRRDEPLAEFHANVEVVDQTVPAVYRVQPAPDANRLVAFRPEKTERVAPHWLFGSGTHAQTYVAQGTGKYVELRLSYYPPVKKWNLTPGQGKIDAAQTALGAVYSPLGIASCFGCHATVLVGTPDALDLDRSRLNVGCESCHGGGRAHVESATKLASGAAAPAELVRPPVLRDEAVTELCARCHRSQNDIKPGDPAFESQLARFAGVALMRSRCFTESAGKLSCVSCHNPHEPASREPVSYDAACRKCHAPSGATACKAGKTAACVSCHMPEQKIARRLPLQFHNHWIKVWNDLASAKGAAPHP